MTRDYRIDDGTLIKAAASALTRPPDSMWWDREELFVTHGLMFAQTRDSDALERSNYRRILADLREKYPGDVDDLRASHWAVGWIEQIRVRVLKDADGPDPRQDYRISPRTGAMLRGALLKKARERVLGNITDAFRDAAMIGSFLSEQYPVYDEYDYYALESEENHEAFDDEWDSMIRGWDEEEDGPEPSDEEKDAVFERLNSEDTPSGYWRDDLARTVREIRDEDS